MILDNIDHKFSRLIFDASIYQLMGYKQTIFDNGDDHWYDPRISINKEIYIDVKIGLYLYEKIGGAHLLNCFKDSYDNYYYSNEFKYNGYIAEIFKCLP